MFARRLFTIAGIYGLLALAPMYFMEGYWDTQMPPAMNHVEFYYGFAGLGVVFQLVFFVIARDPVRFRPLIGLSILEKLAFAIPAIVLHLQGRFPAPMVAPAVIDAVLAVLFTVAYVKTPVIDVAEVLSTTQI